MGFDRRGDDGQGHVGPIAPHTLGRELAVDDHSQGRVDQPLIERHVEERRLGVAPVDGASDTATLMPQRIPQLHPIACPVAPSKGTMLDEVVQKIIVQHYDAGVLPQHNVDRLVLVAVAHLIEGQIVIGMA